MKTTIAAAGIVLGFAFGFGTHSLISSHPTANYHWAIIERYNAYVSDAAHYTNDPATGFSALSPPNDPEPSLAALVAEGELRHLDLVFPAVHYGREAAKHWMKFAERHKEIVYITGNPSYPNFKSGGVQPLHLNIWFKDSDRSTIQALIKELEGEAAK